MHNDLFTSLAEPVHIDDPYGVSVLLTVLEVLECLFCVVLRETKDLA